MIMNRVFFLILLIAFLVVPLSINNVNDDGISYFDLVVEISENLFEDSKIEEKDKIYFSKDQKEVINEKLQPLKTMLKNGDQIEIITSESSQPSPLWERFAVTSKVKSQLRRFFKSKKISKKMKELGFSFCGPVTVYSFMQASGTVSYTHLTLPTKA